MRANRPELALLRGKRDPQSLKLWVQSFAGGSEEKAQRYALAVATFLGQPPGEGSEFADYLGHYSPNTQIAYSYALTEFFEWAAAHHDRIVPPDRVTRVDTEQYVNWLANRDFSIADEKLKDGDKPDLLKLFNIVQQQGSAKLQDIVKHLDSDLQRKYFGEGGSREQAQLNRKVLSKDVRQLVTMDVLTAEPTWAVLRSQFSQAGLTTWEVPLGKGGTPIPIEEVFTYSVKEYRGASRTTIAQRVSALSSFWRVLMQGENVSGGEPLLKYNVWDAVKARVSRGLSSVKKEAARQQRMPSDNVIKMLRDAPDRTLVQMRNKALLYLMVFAGVRTTELLQLRRSKPPRGEWRAWFDGNEPPALQLLRKGNKLQRIPYPPVALKPLVEFQHELERKSAPLFAQYEEPHEPHFIPREHSAWYYRDLQLPDAPLFPPLHLWGRNQKRDYRKSMSRIQCFRVLKTMAKEAGLSPEEVAEVHPHAIRHFSANAMVSGGKDLREVQAILGHASVVTTEGYLQDVDEEVKLSGQEAILSFLQTRGEPMQATYDGTQDAPSKTAPRTVIDTVAEEQDDAPEVSDLRVEVSPAEVEVINRLVEVPIPVHVLPEPPPHYDPAATLMAMPDETEPVVLTDEGLVGLDGTESAEVLLEDLAQTVRDGQSPGSPVWVYEAMAEPKATHETIIFNRGGERDLDWLLEHYPKIPTNFGVGHESYLPWYVKARGNISRGGYFKGLPPFPVFAPEQCNPETDKGQAFVERVEQVYSYFVHGDPENNVLPSPLRSVGIIRWYSFFVYHAKKLEAHFEQQVQAAVPNWMPFNAVVDLRDIRAHDDAWLVQWLSNNAHTYRASVDAMKRGVSRSDTDITASFLRSSFEGIELITTVPDWMIYDDPVRQLYESDPSQYKEMIAWLKNVTGQNLEAGRKLDREEQEEFAIIEEKTKARSVRDLLLSVVKLVDQLEFAKHQNRSAVPELRGQLRTQLYWYATAAGGVNRLRVSLDGLKAMTTREFNQAMAKEYERLGVPDPNAEPYRSLRGKRRVEAIVKALFPELPELQSGNVFAESALFDPRWFRIDDVERTIKIEESEKQKLQRQFGQDPELLVRRATRAMWEARDKGHEAMWGVMMSYFSWIVPSGSEMQSQVLGIPVADLGEESLNVEARKNWLKAWTAEMKRLAMGETLLRDTDDLLESSPEVAEEKPAWQRYLEEEGKTGQDALDYIAGDGVDFAMATSVSGGYADSPEELYSALEEYSEEYYQNPRKRRLIPNGRASCVYLQGEKPKHWYQVDLFGRKEGHLRPNAPPKLMSPGAIYRSQKRVFAARQLLPSPFRMIAAMDLVDD